MAWWPNISAGGLSAAVLVLGGITVLLVVLVLLQDGQADGADRPVDPNTGLSQVVREMQVEQAATVSELPVMFSGEKLGSNFDFNRWELHRSPSRYGRLLLGAL